MQQVQLAGSFLALALLVSAILTDGGISTACYVLAVIAVIALTLLKIFSIRNHASRKDTGPKNTGGDE